MKIAVYAIAKNEARHAARFMESAKDADGVFVLDTGSTDDTVERLRALGAVVNSASFSPHAAEEYPSLESVSASCCGHGSKWRFDTARNEALEFVPEDYDVCVSLDLDEVLVKGWREALEKAFAKNIVRAQALYTYSWINGKADLTFYLDRAHRRKCFFWSGIVHEILCTNLSGDVASVDGFKIEHYPDCSKSRAQYLPLLEQACYEEPDNDRNSHYLGREYFFSRDYAGCIRELERHLALKSAFWRPERAASMIYLAQSYVALKNDFQAECWYLRACAEWPEGREPWLTLALHYLTVKNYAGGYFAATRALKITYRPLYYLTRGEAWGSQPYDIAATCAWYLGLKKEALVLYEKALELSPENERIGADLKFTRENQ